jgi:hypothetical protein
MCAGFWQSMSSWISPNWKEQTLVQMKQIVAAGTGLLGVFIFGAYPVTSYGAPALPSDGSVQYADAETAPPPRPLMGVLDQIGVGNLMDSAKLSLYGYVEGSYTYNFEGPGISANNPFPNRQRLFDSENDRAILNQLDLSLERKVDPTANQLDVGFHVEGVFGGDARFIHGSGEGEPFGMPLGSTPRHPHDLLYTDLYQAYFDVVLPLGNGLRIRAGKFAFFKTIDPNASVFYSHTLWWASAIPFTNTGVTAAYYFSDALSAEAGFSRGWDETLRDNNGAIDAIGRVRYQSDATSAALSLSTGPELSHDNSHYVTVVELNVQQYLSDNLRIGADAIYGHKTKSAAGENLDGLPAPVSADNWYGVAAYSVVKIDSHFSPAVRVEAYRDEGGFTTGNTTATNVGLWLYEATLGVTITPLPNDALVSNLKLRPELRYDYASKDFYVNGAKRDQCTAAIDVIFNY